MCIGRQRIFSIVNCSVLLDATACRSFDDLAALPVRQTAFAHFPFAGRATLFVAWRIHAMTCKGEEQADREGSK